MKCILVYEFVTQLIFVNKRSLAAVRKQRQRLNAAETGGSKDLEATKIDVKNVQQLKIVKSHLGNRCRSFELDRNLLRGRTWAKCFSQLR